MSIRNFWLTTLHLSPGSCQAQVILAKDRQTEQRRAVKVNPDHFRGETVGKNAVKTHRFRHVEPRIWGVFFFGESKKKIYGGISGGNVWERSGIEAGIWWLNLFDVQRTGVTSPTFIFFRVFHRPNTFGSWLATSIFCQSYEPGILYSIYSRRSPNLGFLCLSIFQLRLAMVKQ